MILIGEGRLKCTAMQVHLDDIGGGEPRLAKGAVTKSS